MSHLRVVRFEHRHDVDDERDIRRRLRRLGEVMNITVTVAAVKQTRHGAYGRRLAVVNVVVADDNTLETSAHAQALPLLQAQLAGLKITTEIVKRTAVTMEVR